ncbi:hypothetical protein [Sinomicrobium soli]|uniref:hypothetical protein n=1 Tax=Sinomicrobium sp. N-1-3-6 TaxID=2219864 RepID=UPI000DCEEF07|nr:hypothetical protein [Sinomicrobium sp. N-1-3-6]RAV30541.1 hypothetical protein DN748_03325 [Sinomicrobium sp. N-1-3-6]
MKKSFLKTALITCTVLTGMISCDNVEEDLIPEQEEEREITAQEMRNEKNPYDKQGILHNELLDYYIEHTDDVKDITPDRWIVITKAFYDSKKMDFEAVNIENYKENLHLYEKAAMNSSDLSFDLCKYVPILCDGGSTGPYDPTPAFPGPFFSDDGNADNDSTHTNRVVEYLRAVRAEEDKILANTKLSDEERIALLNYTAVARHSAGYWHNVMHVQKSKNNWYGYAIQSEAAARPCLACDAIYADALGTAVGTVLMNDTAGAILGAYASAISILY